MSTSGSAGTASTAAPTPVRDLVTDEPDISGLPPLDADAGLISRAWNAGDHIDVEVMTAAEALDEQASIAERGFAHGIAYSDDAPDEMYVAPDGRPVAVRYSADRQDAQARR